MDIDLIAVDGVFSTQDAARHGLDKNALSRLVRAGRCVRLSPGWFGVVTGASEPVGEELHRLRTRAMGRQYAARAAVSHHSLLLLRRLPTYAADLRTVHLTAVVGSSPARPGERAPRGSVTVRRGGVTIHRSVQGVRLASVTESRRPPGQPGPLPLVMPVAHAIVQAGLIAGPEAALVPADAALAKGMVTPEALARAVSAFAGHTGVGPVRAALPFADPRHESPGESRAAFVLRALGFELEPQVDLVVDGQRYRPDFRIRGTHVLVEFDGAAKYTDRRDLFAEKRREDALRRAGWVVVRLVWADLDRPERVRQRMADALALAA